MRGERDGEREEEGEREISPLLLETLDWVNLLCATR